MTHSLLTIKWNHARIALVSYLSYEWLYSFYTANLKLIAMSIQNFVPFNSWSVTSVDLHLELLFNYIHQYYL